MLNNAIAHDPQGTSSASTLSATVSFALFLMFFGTLYRTINTKLYEKSRNKRILTTLTLVLALFAVSVCIIYPVLFFVIIWLT